MLDEVLLELDEGIELAVLEGLGLAMVDVVEVPGLLDVLDEDARVVLELKLGVERVLEVVLIDVLELTELEGTVELELV